MTIVSSKQEMTFIVSMGTMTTQRASSKPLYR